MSHSLRFLGLAVTAWVGVRAISLGLIPGTEAIAFDRAEAATTPPTDPRIPPVEPTMLAPPPPIQAAAPYPSYPPYPNGYPAYYPASPVSRFIVYDQGAPRRSIAPSYVAMRDVPGLPYGNGEVRPLDEWPIARVASAPRGGQSRPVPATPEEPPAPPRFDRWQFSNWAMLRDKPGQSSLATNGTLGGSQAGSRLLYRFNPRLAASLRVSAPVNAATRGGEAAVGVRYQPFLSVPVALTAERRQAFGHGAGRSGFALLAEGGLWQRPVAAGFLLDGYLQAGVVGPRHRALFVDGSATLTRPIWRNISGGFGAWGGAQPGLTRLDVGPRLSAKVGKSMRAHLDYRYRALGNAEPGSGAVVTVAADF